MSSTLDNGVRIPRRGRAGFTLVEVVVVVLIIGMAGTVAMVAWQALLPNQRLNTAIRGLSETLYGTRSEAIARSREYRIYYDIDNDSYAVRTPFLLGGGWAQTEEDERLWINDTDLAEAGIDLVQVTIDDTTYTDGEVYVRFDPLGASSYHTVVLDQPIFDRGFTVEALPLTGDVRVHDGLYERPLADENDFQ